MPNSLFEAKAFNILNKNDFVSNNEPFSFIVLENYTSIFTNVTKLFLLNSSKHDFADGTFLYASKYFLQIYKTHVYLNGFMCLLCLFL